MSNKRAGLGDIIRSLVRFTLGANQARGMSHIEGQAPRPEETDQLLFSPGKSLLLCLVPTCLSPNPHPSLCCLAHTGGVEAGKTKPLVPSCGSLPSKHLWYVFLKGSFHVAGSAGGSQEPHSSLNVCNLGWGWGSSDMGDMSISTRTLSWKRQTWIYLLRG